MFWQIAKSLSRTINSHFACTNAEVCDSWLRWLQQTCYVVCYVALLFGAGCASLPSAPRVEIPDFIKGKKASVSEENQSDESAEESWDTPQRQPLIARQAVSQERRTHDPQTQRLIQEELADASPEERAEWTQFLASIETSMVPYVLESRRANRSQHPPRPKDDIPTQKSEDSLIVNSDIESETDGNSQQARADRNEIQLASREEKEQVTDGNTDTNRDWSGRLRSLTEWDKNPLNFSKGDGTQAGERPRPLPKIISNPFGKNQEADASHSKITDELQQESSSEKVKTEITPDSLRITPGAKLWEEELHKLVSLMEAEASAAGLNKNGNLSREELRQHVALRMLYLVNSQPEMAMQPIPGLEVADQEFWNSLFWGLSHYLNEQGADPAERSTKAIEQLRSATHYLQFASKLQLRNVSFCSSIKGFGSYDQFPYDEFAAGQPVLIYCDIHNFQSEATDDGNYVTKLRSSIEIYQGNVDGHLVERNPFPATEDRCRTMRSDYYHSYRIDLPANLSPGPHVLKLTVYDELSGKSATSLLNFQIR